MSKKEYQVIVADPAWPFSDKLPGPGRGAEKHYPTLSIGEIARFPLPVLARSSVLFLWRVASMQEEALFVMRAWGFKPYTELVWQKTTRGGKQHFGMGRLLRASHETCLIGVRGKAPIKNRSTRSTFTAPVGRHSEKPNEFYQLVESLYDGPYGELFARRKRAGWTTWGNELRRAHP